MRFVARIRRELNRDKDSRVLKSYPLILEASKIESKFEFQVFKNLFPGVAEGHPRLFLDVIPSGRVSAMFGEFFKRFRGDLRQGVRQ